MENYIWSLDISTTNLGASLWDMNGKLIELKHLSLKIDKDVNVDHRDLHKANLFKEYCQSYKKHIKNELNGELSHIFVEAPLQNTPKNINTTALLLGFNGMARYVLYQVFDFMPETISVYNARLAFCRELVSKKKVNGEIKETLSFPPEYRKKKKEYIWEKVAKMEPQIDWYYTRNDTLKDINFDMSDSYCVGYAGLKKLGIIKE
ncbi:MAG: hypothetical protein ACOC33_01100 [bacterium]